MKILILSIALLGAFSSAHANNFNMPWNNNGGNGMTMPWNNNGNNGSSWNMPWNNNSGNGMNMPWNNNGNNGNSWNMPWNNNSSNGNNWSMPWNNNNGYGSNMNMPSMNWGNGNNNGYGSNMSMPSMNWGNGNNNGYGSNMNMPSMNWGNSNQQGAVGQRQQYTYMPRALIQPQMNIPNIPVAPQFNPFSKSKEHVVEPKGQVAPKVTIQQKPAFDSSKEQNTIPMPSEVKGVILAPENQLKNTEVPKEQ